jgi:chemotaxis protein methyltransferase CheR
MTISANATQTSAAPVSDELMAKYAELVYRHAGIHLTPQKKMLLANRLRRRLRATGIPSFEAYFEHLRKSPLTDPEWDAFLQEVTTHETFLFRDEAQWQWFRKEFLPGIAEEANNGKRPRTLRIWSAACSTGDEAYTAASCVVASLPDHTRWSVQIVGTDIGIEAVSQARKPTFNERAMQLVPNDIRTRFFDHDRQAACWRPKAELTKLTKFQQHNLMKSLAEKPFDLVFIKNVLIYFDEASKRTVLDHVRRVLRPEGLLIAGGAEGIGDLIRDMRRLKPWLYRHTTGDAGQTRAGGEKYT